VWQSGYFRQFTAAKSVDQLSNAKTLIDFHAELLAKVEQRKLGRNTANAVMLTAKSFVKWCWQSDVIRDLPRNIDAKSLRISVPKTKVPTIPVPWVKSFLAAANGRPKLYALLMLNIGATQKDINDLQQAEVDWDAGIIVRRRSKTAECESTPIVSYKLWPETFRLLKQFRSSDPVRVLVNQRGGPLWNRSYNSERDKSITIDLIGKSYKHACKTLKMEPIYSPKLFRKTSSSLLNDNETYHSLHTLFLGHSARTVADAHYNTTPQARLDTALLWLGQQYGVVPAPVEHGTQHQDQAAG
jgi:integrase